MTGNQGEEPDQRSGLLQQALENIDSPRMAELLASAHPAEIADLLESIPREERLPLWRRLEDSQRGEILLETHGEVRRNLIQESDEEQLLVALAALEVDELADLDADLPRAVIERMVGRMDADRWRQYESVRHYPDDTAGGLMDVDAASVRADVTIKTVLRFLRQLRARAGGLPEHLDSLMVVDRDHRYLGILKLSDVASLETGVRVHDVMSTEVPAIHVLTPATTVARQFEDKDLISSAVIDEHGLLVGRITIDDVVDVMRSESERELMSRVGLSEATDMFAPLPTSVRRRSPWLGLNLMNAFIAAWVIGLFEDSIQQVVALAVIMPVVASMGGVAGNQTLTLVTRGIALDQLGPGNAGRLFLREFSLGLVNGLFWALVVGVIAVLWFDSVQLALVFGAALLLNLLVGSTVGTLVPLALDRMGIDPALAGGVVLTATTDVLGFLIFLGLASYVLL
jgi:magnesium transporter